KGAKPESAAAGVFAVLGENFRQPMSALIFQVIVIVVAARVVGALMKRIGQPAVVGEMAAGVLLGPSFLGLAFPGAQSFIFPPPSLGGLRMLSQIGVILFLFVVGLDLDISHLRQ